jgi:hypothetical protein
MLGSSYPNTKASGRCALTDRPFAAGDSYVAVLVDEGIALPSRDGEPATRVPSGKLCRIDVCASAWQEGKRPGGEIFGFWKATHHPERDDNAKALLDDGQLLDMFDATPAFEPSASGEAGHDRGDGRGEATADAKQVRFRYLLALLLIRRKQLRVVASKLTRDGTVLHVLRKGEPLGTSPTLVLDPKLDDIAIAEALDQFGAVLDAR